MEMLLKQQCNCTAAHYGEAPDETGGTVASGGFSDIGLQEFAPKLAKGEIASLCGAG